MGVEFVMDVDCMPLVTLESMLEAIKRQNVSVDKLYANSKEPRVNGQSNTGGSMFFTSTEHPDNAHYMSSSNHSLNTLVRQAQGDTVCAISHLKLEAADIVNAQQAIYSQPCAMTQVQVREADVRTLSELTCALDKKEALLMELRHANSDVLESQSNAVGYFKDSEPFKKHSTSVLVQLEEASDQVSSAVLHLRQRNTFPGNSRPLWLKQPAISNGPSGPQSSADNLSSNSREAGSNVIEIYFQRIKIKSTLNGRCSCSGNVFNKGRRRCSEALNSLGRWQISSDSGISVARSPDPANNSLGHHNHLTSCTMEPLLTGHASGSLYIDSDTNELQVPSELITLCVATLLMIQPIRQPT